MAQSNQVMAKLIDIFYSNGRIGPGYVASCMLIAGLLIPVPGIAQVNDVRLPITLDADSTNYDGKNSMLMFEGLRLTQGNIGIQADSGRASKLDFEDSVWEFSGNVVIDTESGHIECESADLNFSEHALTTAKIIGSPATFRLRRPESDEVTYAEAGQLDYDFSRGVIEFSGDAVITEGGNQISSNFLVYNIEEQRINAQSAGEGEPRVKITYTPRTTPNGLEILPGTDSVQKPPTSDEENQPAGDGEAIENSPIEESNE
jgi:lipopolysaccharide transport protein LptA